MRGGHFPTYLSPEKVVLTFDAFVKLRDQTPNPYIMRQFEDEKISVVLKHAYSIKGARDVPKEHWLMYEVMVENIITTDIEGNPQVEQRIKDVDGSKGFRTEAEAIQYYEQFLASYTESSFNSLTGVFEEATNKFTPVNPDQPTVAKDSPIAESFGSW